MAGELLGQTGESLALKTVRRRYGVSYPVARDALTRLEKHGLVYRFARGFRRRQHRATRQPSTLALIVRVSNPTSSLALSPRMQRWFFSIQSESARLRTRLAVVPVSHRQRPSLPSAREVVRQVLQQSGGVPLLGCIIVADGFRDRYLASLSSAASSVVDCVAVVGTTDEDPLTRSFAGSRLRFFAPARDVDAGRSVGLSLVDAGHRRVAFFTDSPPVTWSSRRFHAVRTMVAAAGGTVASIALPASPSSPPDRACVARHVDGLFSALEQSGAHWFANAHEHDSAEIVHAILAHDGRLRGRAALRTALRDIIQQKAATAIVAARDQLALECVHLLRALGVAVPEGGVSLVSFDNSFAAAVEGVSSYDFNFVEAIRRATEWLLAPNRQPVWSDRDDTVAYAEGFLVDRGSIARMS